MIHHPLLLTVAVLDLLAGLLLASAAVTAAQVVLRWAPERADRAQLRLEGRAEGASILARSAVWLLLTSSLALVVAGYALVAVARHQRGR